MSRRTTTILPPVPPVNDWASVAHDEAKLLGPYFRRGLKVFGPAYVYAVVRSLHDAVETQTLGTDGVDPGLAYEVVGAIERAHTTLEQLARRTKR